MNDKPPVDIAVVGAIALDEIHSHAGDIDHVLGGSAVYASLAAAPIAAVAAVSVIGDDLDQELLQPLVERQVNLDAVPQADGPNFRWGCRYSADGNTRETLYTRAGVYDSFPIAIPQPIRRASHLLLTAGNPDQNHRAIAQMDDPKVVAIDTIEREVAERRLEFREQLQFADIVSINTLEAAHLVEWSGELDDPQLALAAWDEIRALGPQVFILKQASYGVEIFEAASRTHVSAVPEIIAVDPTGAGDTFIGALLSALAHGCDLVQAAIWGCSAASFTIESFGIDGIASASRKSIAQRCTLITVDGETASTPHPLSR